MVRTDIQKRKYYTKYMWTENDFKCRLEKIDLKTNFILIIIYILTFDVKVIMVFNLICNKYYSFTHKTFMHKLNN
jgi:hypothetical protein